MKCGQAEKWMDAALDELSGGTDFVPAGWTAQRRAELEMHLSGCAACRAQWEVLRSAEAVLRVPKPVPPPESLLADFRQRLAAEERREERPAQRDARRGYGWRWLWPLGSVAAAGVAAAAVFVLNIQAPMTPMQEIKSPEHRDYRTVSPAPVAMAPRAGKRKVAVSSPAVSLPKGKTTLADRGRPTPQRIASAPSFDGAMRPVTPQMPIRAPVAERGAAPPGDTMHPQTEARDLDRLAGNHPKESLRNDAPIAEQESKSQLTPLRAESQARGKPALSKDIVGLAEKPSVYFRQHAEANSLQQKQFGSQVGTSAQLSSVSKQLSQSATLNNGSALEAQNSEIYYAQVPAEPTPVELSVSAAVLNALQRPVEVRTQNVRVDDLALQLSTDADVEVKVDPQAGRMSVTLGETGAPLWRVLEDVARQTQMEIYPSDNTLLLRPSKQANLALGLAVTDKVEPRRYPDARSKKELNYPSGRFRQDAKPPAEAPTAPGGSPTPASALAPAPRGPAGGAGGGLGGFGGGAGGGFGRNLRTSPRSAPSSAPFIGTRLAYSSRQPDRKYWPAAWGNLPERGFEIPTAEELPPLILAPVQVGKALTNEVPQVRLRRTAPAKPAAKKARSSR